MDDFTWLKHAETGGYFRCPNAAVDDMAELGWRPSEAPEEPNPTVAESLAWRAAQAEPKPTKAATRGKTEE